MESIAVTLNGAVRRVALNGRNYLVAPVTMLVSGVLNGSQGPLYYPPGEVERNPMAWNGMPLLLGHPLADDGEHISGRDPQVWANRHLGHVFNVTAEDGKLKGEAWFEANACKDKDPKLTAMLEAGKPIEVSTGLFTEDEIAPAGAHHNGERYERIARNYRPDHLAVLMDEPGACSVADGCGVNVVNTETEVDMVDRKKLIASLVANCSCWKKNPAKLNKLTDGQLVDLATNAAKAVKLLVVFNAAKGKGKANEDDPEGEVAGIDIAALAEFLGVAADAAADPVAFIAELKGKVAEVLDKLGGAAESPPTPEAMAEGDPEPTEEDEPVEMADSAGKQGQEDAFAGGTGEDSEGSSSSGSGASDQVGDARRNSRRKPQTEQQWLASAPPRIRSIVNSAIARERQERSDLLARIVANIDDEAQRKRLWGRYAKIESLDELRELADLVNPVQPDPVPNWLGSAGGPVGNAASDDEDIEDMIPPGFRVRA